MTAIFPDSGVPPADAKNSLPDPNTNCLSELWHSTSRCQPRFDPAAANAVMSEILNLVNKPNLAYDCNRLDNMQEATRYLIQRGLCQSTYLWNGPQAYAGFLDPPMTTYNNFLTLVVIPAVTNIGGVTIDVDYRGAVPLLRNDYAQLETGDLRVGIPYIITFRDGYFLMVGLCASQVPIIVKGGIEVWIRTDGSDTTGDGSANTPGKAYRTIAGAWAGVATRYAATPLFSIHLRLGIPGTYEGAYIGPFGSSVWLTGDIYNRSAYKIASAKCDPNTYAGLWVQGINGVNLSGVTIQLSHAGPEWCYALRVISSAVSVQHCAVEATVSNPYGVLFNVARGLFGAIDSELIIDGHNNTLYAIFDTNSQSACVGAWRIYTDSIYTIRNMTLTGAAHLISSLSTMHYRNTGVSNVDVIGLQYVVVENSIMSMGGQPVPGTVGGWVSTGGIFIP